MQYAVGKPGRIIVVRLSQGDKLYESIESVAKTENIKSAAVFITGGISDADVVVGPKSVEPKIVAEFKHFTGPGEVLGVGTIHCDEEGPKMHIHTAMSKGDDIVVGCPRGGADVFLVLEVTIIEIEGINATRKLEESSGLKLLSLD